MEKQGGKHITEGGSRRAGVERRRMSVRMERMAETNESKE